MLKLNIDYKRIFVNCELKYLGNCTIGFIGKNDLNFWKFFLFCFVLLPFVDHLVLRGRVM